MSIVVVAEKPSVARDVAQAIGAQKRGAGYFSGNGYTVTWALGHLVALPEPHQIDARWQAWKREQLPMLPRRWPLQIIDKTRPQFEVVKGLLNDPRTTRLICATDAGREGELIFRYLYEAAGCKKPFARLWISSLTPEAIKRGFDSLMDGRAYDALAAAARARSRADWLVGMNLSRAYSLAGDDVLSVGRVQTPTLAMLVERELAIQAFVPEDYVEVVATFAVDGGAYDGTYVDAKHKPVRLPKDGEAAALVVARARSGKATITDVRRDERRELPPLLYDLTELQRHANRLHGFTAERTLAAAQSLYEEHKLISYPRTDSRHLSRDAATTLPAIVSVVADAYAGKVAAQTTSEPIPARFVDDGEVRDHHAIIPTTQRSALSPGSDAGRIYDLVCRRLLAAWHAPYRTAVTTVLTTVDSPDVADVYRSSGVVTLDLGWRVLEPPRKLADAAPDLPAGLARGASAKVQDAKAVDKRTKPPPHLTDATLLTAMETAGKNLDDEELTRAMQGHGLGTPATRAATIETLIAREYLRRDGKGLRATPKGIALIAAVHAEVKSPRMTAEWEHNLFRVERGEGDEADFMARIEAYVRRVVGEVGSGGSVAPSPMRTAPDASPVPQRAAIPADELPALLRARFGFTQFRPHQEAICRAITEGNDALVVMPTGAGKSLCYQLPGIARGGTTLVLSPLIALMEDQVSKLRGMGFAAERIHSGCERAASRQVCLDYLAGKLDFLFIAPERLRVPRFPEMLARRKPTLIAIDEAHCISQWGHDFRPDYRMLQERLPILRPTPVVALTATATADVQADIATQLGLSNSARFIHGFRRDNLAIEVVEVDPASREGLVQKLLAKAGRVPALVYAPTRKDAEKLALRLAKKHASAAYHAGLSPGVREQVQGRFLSGELDVVVATIAFGMGIDKPDVRTVVHTALPGSVEGYYQEIGRAGRDGQPSRAFLLHGFVDRKTHTFFFERDYPEVQELERLFKVLSDQPQTRESVQARVRLEDEVFDKWLDKLWAHRGARFDGDALRRGDAAWKASYVAQRAHKLDQLDAMTRFTATKRCRMRALVEYFGDRQDAGKDCGHCDTCTPSSSLAQVWRAPNAREQKALETILDALYDCDDVAAGTLFRDTCEGSMERRAFERLVDALARARFVVIAEATFEKDGKVIPFRRLRLTSEGRRAAKRPSEVAGRVTLSGIEVPKARTGSKKKARRARPEP